MADWPIWAVPRRALWVVLLVEVAAVASLVMTARSGIAQLPPDGLWRMVVLAVAGVVSTECSLGVERMRLPADDGPHIDLSSVWAFAAAALLPSFPACVVVIVVYAHIYLRVERRAGVPPHQVLFTASTIVLAVHTAAMVMSLDHTPADPYHTALGLTLVVLAVFAYAAVNMLLVVGVIVLAGEQRDGATFLRLLRGDEFVLEFATLSMGALVGGAMVSFGLAYAVLVLPPLIMLHRTVLVRQLEEAASTDAKTGLLNAVAWQLQAGNELRRAQRAGERAAVLVLDLDHFKQVNDRYGHLVGDSVLSVVAQAVRSEVRDDDLVGRFGGEEFVVLLRAVDGTDHHTHAAAAVAERIRRTVAALGVEVPSPHGPYVVDDFTVSIGCALFPHDGLTLARLLETADAAMYEAKNTGRNCVRMGTPAMRQRPAG